MESNELNALVDARVNQALAAILLREKASGTTGLAISPHGYNSLWNQPGVEPGVVSTIVKPSGLEAWLEARGHVQKSQYLNPLFEILTGQTASTGNEPTGPCSEDVPVAGDLKVCHQTWGFGEFTMKSKPIRVDSAGAMINRSEPLDLRLLNNPFADLPNITPGGTNIFRSRLAKATAELTLDFRRRYARKVYTGSPLSATYVSEGVFGSEYNGLDRIVTTGYKDVLTQQTCSAADAIVVNRAGANIQATGSATVQTYVEYYRHVSQLAKDLGIEDVEFAFFGRRQKFLALTEIWPCVYGSYRCMVVGTGASVNIDATAQNEMRERMRKGSFLLIDGEEVPWISDNTQTEFNIGSGNFQSDTYLLPVRAPSLGGQLLYMDYFDYNGEFGMRSIISEVGPRDEYRVSPDGRYAIFFMGGVAFCKQVMMRTRKRIILRTPFLAVKIEDERYAVYVHEREWEPGSSFFEDGGLTSFAGTSFYSPV
jgi:hypothetical protein